MAQVDNKVVVIGAGLGGLSSALRLVHQGLSVTVVEAQSGPGGKMRTLPSLAGPVDAGPTVLTLRHVFDDLFESVGTRLSDHVTLTPDDILARHWWPDGTTLDLHADPEMSARAIRDFAGPRAEQEFRAFGAHATRLFDAFDAPMMQEPDPRLASLARAVLRNPTLIPSMAPLATLAGTLARRFTDPRLRQLFGRYATYVGGSPYAAPALLALIWSAEARGVWRIHGGMHRLAIAMADLAAEKGASFRYNCAAKRIEAQGNRVAAVHLADSSRIAANCIVFNGDPSALARGLLGTAAQRAVPATAVTPRSLSAYVWTFAARPIGSTLAHHNVFFCDDYRAEFDDLAAGCMPTAPTLYVCAQDRGGIAPLGPERFEIIMNGPPAALGAPADPQEAKTCRTRVFDTLARFGLRFDPPPAESALTTPADFAALFPGSDGSIYGRSPHGMTASLKRPRARTVLPGLYLAGGGAHPGAGIPMATLSGMHAAAAILADRASTSTSPRMATPGGISTRSATAVKKPSASSAS